MKRVCIKYKKEGTLMNYIDLHVHSSCSDGSLSPEEVVELAKEAGLTYFALTDHDTVKGVGQAIKHAQKIGGINVIAGAELSCYTKDREVHVLGLNINYEDKNLIQELANLETARNRRNEQMVQKFVDAGIPMTIEELKHGDSSSVITRAHFARLLVEKGFVKDKAEAFDKYIGIHCPFYLPKPKVTPEHVISLIKSAGGKAILAHPFSYKYSKSEVEQLIDRLIPEGLDGIECYYSTYDEGQISELRSIAFRKNLIVSGGSDFHGAIKPDISIGTGRGSLRVPEKLVDAILA